MFGAILKATTSSFQKGMVFCRSIYVKKVMKLLASIFEQPSYIWFIFGDIADTLGETFCHNSSSFNYSESFRKIKTEQEKVKLNFKSQNNEIYNKDFNLDELVEAFRR